jgi:hypothetical protein
MSCTGVKTFFSFCLFRPGNRNNGVARGDERDYRLSKTRCLTTTTRKYAKIFR